MSVNATAVGRVAIMGATGVGGLDGGYVVLEWVKAQTHDKLVLQQQPPVVVSRPELADYGLKVLWASAQMEHARGATQAQQVSAATTPNWSRDGDVHMAAVLQDASSRAANAQEPSLLWHLQGECAKLAAGGDWDGVSVLSGAIVALAKGKGQRERERHREGKFQRNGVQCEKAPTDPEFTLNFFQEHRNSSKMTFETTQHFDNLFVNIENSIFLVPINTGPHRLGRFET